MAVVLPELKLPCVNCHKNPSLQKENGCVTDSQIPDRWEIHDYKLQRCPGSIITRQSSDYIQAYNWREKGFLPNPGGWMEQPAKLIQAIKVIEKAIQRINNDSEEKLKIGSSHR